MKCKAVKMFTSDETGLKKIGEVFDLDEKNAKLLERDGYIETEKQKAEPKKAKK